MAMSFYLFIARLCAKMSCVYKPLWRWHQQWLSIYKDMSLSDILCYKIGWTVLQYKIESYIWVFLTMISFTDKVNFQDSRRFASALPGDGVTRLRKWDSPDGIRDQENLMAGIWFEHNLFIYKLFKLGAKRHMLLQILTMW
jgi:hypothetical protein